MADVSLDRLRQVANLARSVASALDVDTVLSQVVDAVLSLREVDPHATPGPLAVALTARVERFACAFRRVALSQLWISAFNTSFLAIYLLIALHHLNHQA